MRLHYATPDAAAADYFRLRDHLASARAQRFSETVEVCATVLGHRKVRQGFAVVEEPVHCSGHLSPATVRILDHGDDWLGRVRLHERRDICSDCAEPWKPLEIEVGFVRDRGSVRPDAAEDALLSHLSRLMPLRRLIEPRPRAKTEDEWTWALSLWRVYLHPCVGTYSETARIAEKATMTESWPRAKVEREITGARGVVEQRIARRGGMREWNEDEIKLEIARLEAKVRMASRLDVIALEKTIERLRGWLKRSGTGGIGAQWNGLAGVERTGSER